ncbi:CsgG/HfaB family protein [Flavobacterium sp.]|uniref:CsgG/HfaB family protein n=1 Tax=Flavobacterium sp. TaxID=239 RepID=UPI00286E236A|nr:CsgG/HfaB family protein [Flavobacterium sp.]
MKKYTILLCLASSAMIVSCGSYFNQPLGIQKATLGESTVSTITLKNLPKPLEPIVVGVYKFRDQTGQYKAADNGSTFSTAVTQGATTILIKALEDSKWFTPIERENLGNLLNERNIIRSTRQEYSKNTEATETQLTPLLFAGVLVEGGIISYDSNILTGGFGARYFGAGISTRYRQDRISVYLRLVSTSNGKILKTVYVSKTILSQAIDASLFRYVKFKRLLEVETGYTKNEPIHLAVTEAIEKGVESLIIEGIRDNIWQVNAPILKITELINQYDKEKAIADETQLYGRHLYQKRGKFGLELSGGGSLINDDYANPSMRPMIRGAIKYFISPTFNLSASTNAFWFGNTNKLEVGYASWDLNVEALLLPFDKYSPYVFAGLGYNSNSAFENKFMKAQFGAGIEYMIADNIGIKAFGESNITNNDNLDYLIKGAKKDSFLRFGLGLSYYFGKRKPKQKIEAIETNYQELINTNK